MELSRLAPAKGARKRRKRVGFGESSGHGKTSTRGGKGQTARTGGKVRAGFEGGQMPLYRRLPKYGFVSQKKNAGLNVFSAINLDTLDAFPDGSVVDVAFLKSCGMLKGRDSSCRVKILGRGSLSKKLTLRVHAVSEAARSRIEAAGGSVEIVGQAAA